MFNINFKENTIDDKNNGWKKGFDNEFQLMKLPMMIK